MMRSAAFAACIVSALAVLGPWFDGLADTSFAWHMVQHLVLMMVSAPLFVLAVPLRTVLALAPPRIGRALARALRAPLVRVLTTPLAGWAAITLVLYVAHFSGLYEAALENERVHAFEHGLFFATAVLFWQSVIAPAPVAHPPSYPARLLAIFFALPASAFLGLAFYVATRPLYPHYVAAAGSLAALTDQRNGGAVMWIGGGVILFAALLLTIARWGAAERRYGHQYDRYIAGQYDRSIAGQGES
jgi:cytochrome c oxidase assembly factor CtaG